MLRVYSKGRNDKEDKIFNDVSVRISARACLNNRAEQKKVYLIAAVDKVINHFFSLL